MKIKILDSFFFQLGDQVEFIAQDKPLAARKFKKDVITRIKEVQTMPFRCKKSIYFNDENIRDLIFKGYTLVYRVKMNEEIIEFFGIIKHKESL